jgi:uncharacterized protein (TIGR02145 family)
MIHGITALAIILLPNIGLGQVYPEVKIGSQIWMSKNLNVDTFRNGDKIPEAKTDQEWLNAAKNKQPAWCYFHDKSTSNISDSGQVYRTVDHVAKGEVSGKLYNWYAISDPRGLAPSGWHIPTISEWGILGNYTSSGKKDSEGSFLDVQLNGDSSEWGEGYQDIDKPVFIKYVDAHNFNGQPSGRRTIFLKNNQLVCKFSGCNCRNGIASWWSKTEYEKNYELSQPDGWDAYLDGNSRLSFQHHSYGYGQSVRCIKD